MCLDEARETVNRLDKMTGSSETQAPGRPIEMRVIPAGTRVQIAGMPFELAQDTHVHGHPDNFARAAVDVVFPQSDPKEPTALGLHTHNRRHCY